MNTDTIRRRMLHELENGVRDFAEALTEMSKREAPKGPTGDLADSADFEVERVPGAVRATVFYDEYYAIWQHERLDYRHPRGGRAKFLEAPLKAMAPEFVGYLGRRLKRVL